MQTNPAVEQNKKPWNQSGVFKVDSSRSLRQKMKEAGVEENTGEGDGKVEDELKSTEEGLCCVAGFVEELIVNVKRKSRSRRRRRM